MSRRTPIVGPCVVFLLGATLTLGDASPSAAATTTLTFPADADAAVYENSPETNYGTDTNLRTDGGRNPAVESYLKFAVSGISGTIRSAKVRLRATADGTSNGPAIYSTGTSWSETALTWNNRPAPTRGALRDKGSIRANTVVSYDVTRAIAANTSVYGFRLATTSSDAVSFYSREAPTTSSRPVLVVTVRSARGDTSPPTVSLSSPANGASVSGSVAVSATASDNVGVTRVDFFVDGSLEGSDTSLPWGFGLDTTALTSGAHTIGVRAYDAAGNASSLTTISVTVLQPSAACTLYASPTGSSSASGSSPSSALTLDAANAKAQPGYTICLVAGTYSLSSPWYINRSGAPGNYVVYRNYDGVVTLRATQDIDTLVALTSGTHHVEINGLTVDAANRTDSDINCNSADHVRVIGNTLTDGGGAGFSAYRCDYVTVDWNRIYHAGYRGGWSGGISLNADRWSDTAAGFHNIVTHNVVSGTYDDSSYKSDGNGIMIDQGGNVPPTLVANNAVYENYYRCVVSNVVQHVWVINNTCYKNGLRYNPPDDIAGEITSFNSTDIHVINNVVYAWTTPRAYMQDSSSSVTYQHNAAYGGTTSLVPSSVLSDPNQIRTEDPLFVNAPYVDPTADGQWATATPPWEIGTAFQVQPGSPVINQGIDPRTATGMTSALSGGLDTYFATDLANAPRLQTGAYDLGAYEQ
jgi:hypothetical protein